MIIRKAGISDIIALSEFTAHTFRTSWLEPGNEADLEDYVAEHFSFEGIKADMQKCDYWILSDENAWIGYAKTEADAQPDNYAIDKPVALHRIYIDKNYQSAGAGTSLLLYIINYAIKNNFRNIWLGVWNQNFRAIRFYERQGFEIFGTYDFVMGRIVSSDFLMKKEL